MASVNLWELITTVGSKDLPDSDKCRDIKRITGPRFGTELSLDINEITGVWTVEVFDHEDHERKVTLAINPDGFLSVTRCRKVDDITETRKVSF